VLAVDQQLHDLVRFSTSASEFGIITIDPTFTLGDFDVTPITYRHLLLETKRNKQPPIFLGPVLLHYKKTFATYLFFASSLIGLSPQLQGVRAFGTDGEQPLIDAFSHEFGFSQHLTCFLHVRRNIKDELNKYNIPTEVASLMLDDIFGRRLGTVFEEGMVDSSDDADFQMKLDSTLEKWRNLDVCSSADMEGFLQYFTANKVAVIRHTMLRPIRIECGLGNPPEIFTTNASESTNALLKHKVDYRRNELPVFVNKVKELVAEQQKELERAVINRGKYQFREQYRFLQVPESKWFSMTTQQRAKHLTKVQSLAVTEVQESSGELPGISSPQLQLGGSTSAQASAPSVDVLSAAEGMNVPLTCMEGVWRKAGELLQDSDAMVAAPGQSPEARMVLSYAGKAPHLVTPVKGGGYNCDSSCPNWKSIGFCSHTVAVADANKKLAQFLTFLRNKKKTPNMTNLVTSGMPRGRGRKGGVTPRTRKQLKPPEARLSMNVAMGVGNQLDTTGDLISNAIPVTIMQPHPYPTGHFHPGYGSFFPGPSQYQSPGFFPVHGPNPYTLSFIKGNISMCIGCHNRYTNKQPPNDLCIKHQEWRQFTPQGTDSPQSKFSNVYYHCRPECVWLRCPDFVPPQLEVPDEVQEQLSPIHKAHLASVFGLFLP